MKCESFGTVSVVIITKMCSKICEKVTKLCAITFKILTKSTKRVKLYLTTRGNALGLLLVKQARPYSRIHRWILEFGLIFFEGHMA